MCFPSHKRKIIRCIWNVNQFWCFELCTLYLTTPVYHIYYTNNYNCRQSHARSVTCYIRYCTMSRAHTMFCFKLLSLRIVTYMLMLITWCYTVLCDCSCTAYSPLFCVCTVNKMDYDIMVWLLQLQKKHTTLFVCVRRHHISPLFAVLFSLLMRPHGYSYVLLFLQNFYVYRGMRADCYTHWSTLHNEELMLSGLISSTLLLVYSSESVYTYCLVTASLLSM